MHASTALMWAAGGGHTEVAQELVRAGAELDLADRYFQRTALMAAAHKGHTEIVQELVRAGANVNLQDKQGQTALNLAWGGGEINILLDAGAELGTGDNNVLFVQSEVYRRDRRNLKQILAQDWYGDVTANRAIMESFSIVQENWYRPRRNLYQE